MKNFSLLKLLTFLFIIPNLLILNSCAKLDIHELDVVENPEALLLAISINLGFDSIGGVFHVPLNTGITIDGSFADWDTTASLFVTDATGDSTGGAGTDVKRILIAQDGTNLFIFMEMDTNLAGGSNFFNYISKRKSSESTIIKITSAGVISSGTNNDSTNLCNPGGLTASISANGIEAKIPVSSCLNTSLYPDGKSNGFTGSVQPGTIDSYNQNGAESNYGIVSWGF